MTPELTAFLTLVLALALANGCTERNQAGGDTIVIANVTAVDAISGSRTHQDVTIKAGIIQSVADAASAGGTSTVDGSGQFLIPGLWDMHVHFLYDLTLTEVMAGLFLRHGITSVRDTGGDVDRLVKLRARLKASGQPMPHMFIAGPLLDGRLVVYDGADPGRPELGISVPDAQAAVAAVNKLKAAGVDFVKLYEMVDPDTFAALVSEADRLKLPVAAHIPLTMTADEAGPMVDSMEHLRNIELACADDWQHRLAERRARISAFDGRGYVLRSALHSLQRLPAIAAYDADRCDVVLHALRNTIQVPTLRLNTLTMTRAFDRPDWQASLSHLPEDVQQRWLATAGELPDAPDNRFAHWSLFLVERMVAHGVPIGAGTDTPIGLAIPGYSLHTELELLVKAGLTPMQALYAATVQPARFFGMASQIGQIKAGMQADLVLLDADPLANISNTRRISQVMLNGVWVE